MRLSHKRNIAEIVKILEKCVIGLEKRKNGLEKAYGFSEEAYLDVIQERFKYYNYYNGKLYAYLWVLTAFDSKIGIEICDRLIGNIKTINNKCYFFPPQNGKNNSCHNSSQRRFKKNTKKEY